MKSALTLSVFLCVYILSASFVLAAPAAIVNADGSITVSGTTEGSGGPPQSPAKAQFRVVRVKISGDEIKRDWTDLPANGSGIVTSGLNTVVAGGSRKYRVDFSFVNGFKTPASINLELTPGSPSRSVTGDYVSAGSITVSGTTNGSGGPPQSPTKAQFRVVRVKISGDEIKRDWTDLPSDGSGITTTRLNTFVSGGSRTYRVDFSAVSGFLTPDSIFLELTPSTNNQNVIGDYLVAGSITVSGTTDGAGGPPENQTKAQFSIYRVTNIGDVRIRGWTNLPADGSGFKTSGLNILLANGSRTYRIEFRDVNGFLTPGNIQLELTESNNEQSFNGDYISNGSIIVSGSTNGIGGPPQGPPAAQFRLLIERISGDEIITNWTSLPANGSGVTSSGLNTIVKNGSRHYRVEFSDVTGFITPADINQELKPGTGKNIVSINGDYIRETGTLNVEIDQGGSSGSFTIEGPLDFNGGNPLSGQTSNYSDTVPTGTYTVTFTEETGYSLSVTATSFTVASNTANGDLDTSPAETVTGTYARETGTLNVEIDQGGSSGSFTIEGPSDFNSGSSLTGQTSNYSDTVPTGTYTVTFTEETSYSLSVTATSFTVASNTANGDLDTSPAETVTGTYARETGTLNVEIDQDGSSGSFTIEGPSDFNSNSPLTGQTSNYSDSVPTGTYTVTFTEETGYSLAVTATSFTVASNTANGDLDTSPAETVTGTYTRKEGTLNVEIDQGGSSGSFTIEGPSDFNGGSSLTGQTSNYSETVPTGTYTVTFTEDTGYSLVVTANPFTVSSNSASGDLDSGQTETVTGTYELLTNDITVNILSNPSGVNDAVSHGASWTLSGTTLAGDSFISSGSGASDTQTVPHGSYEITFLDTTSGAWQTPSQVSLDVGDTVSPDPVEGLYVELTDSVTIQISEDNFSTGTAAAAGAGWTLSGTTANGDAYNASGSGATTTIADIPHGGPYTIVWSDISATQPFDKPVDNVFSVPGHANPQIGTYTRHVGSLQVTITSGVPGPQTQSSDLFNTEGEVAQWRLLNASGWRDSGNIATGIPTGTVIIEFRPISGFFTPPSQTVSIIKGLTPASIVVHYNTDNTGTGNLQVVLTGVHQSIASEGANPSSSLQPPQWRFAGSDVWYDGDTKIVNIAKGEYPLEFSLVEGHILPIETIARVRPGIENLEIGEYVRPLIVHKSDYDGDGTEDLATYNASTRTWSIASSGIATNVSASARIILEKKFGQKGDIPTPGDYDGDGVADLSYFRERTGEWRVARQFTIRNFGGINDIPVPGDYNGDGRTDPAVYRPSKGIWLVYDVDREKTLRIEFGTPMEDIPVPGNFDGDADGMTDLGVFNVVDGTWRVATFNIRKKVWKVAKKFGGSFGKAGDIPVQGDYDGDGKSDLAVYVRGTGTWSVKDQFEIVLGQFGDIPVPNDWAGLGRVIPAVFRPKSGKWLSVDGLLNAKHGQGTRPMASGR